MGYRTSKVEKELAAKRRYWKNYRKIEDLQKGLKELQSRKDAPAAAKPKPAPKPKPKAPPKEPIKHSSEIQQAKDRVNSYENKYKNQMSPWEQAQANVQSSFIKPNGSSSQEQYDFSSNSFDAKESSKPNEQAQAAQSNLQNNISKYSQYKSNN